ncbi:hypothetical protein pdul_cds_37 [Pandoravirus dulcis]|uniref:Uncharacterized protein n=1 Tax=Pandoravirus dulcis TaxID=1349409 RepID=S4VNR7_9VIRU|nr:hypothetical protein pdul_cds_37 [Pandoravirus dulcis]AGO81913.1 hypothetical protein pdul_cds_37 [Pandoravirus dulcis]
MRIKKTEGCCACFFVAQFQGTPGLCRWAFFRRMEIPQKRGVLVFFAMRPIRPGDAEKTPHGKKQVVRHRGIKNQRAQLRRARTRSGAARVSAAFLFARGMCAQGDNRTDAWG